MKNNRFRHDLLKSQIELAQLQILIMADSDESPASGEPKAYKAGWLKNAGEVWRVGGRFASRTASQALEVANRKLGEARQGAGERIDVLSKEAKEVADELAKKLDTKRREAFQSLEKAAIEAHAAALKKDIKQGILDSHVPFMAEERSETQSRLQAEMEVFLIEASIKSFQKQSVETAKDLFESFVTNPIGALEDRIEAGKEVYASERLRTSKGLPKLSAEQLANLSNAQFHRKRAQRAYDLNPAKRNNARAVVEQVRSAKAAIGMSADLTDQAIQKIGIEADKASQIAKSFKQRASEINPKNIKEKVEEFIADCKLEPKGDPMGELYTYFHAASSVLAAAGGVIGPEGAIALAIAPVAPQIAISTIGANLASLGLSGEVMALGGGEDRERAAGAFGYHVITIMDGVAGATALATLGAKAIRNKSLYKEASKVWAAATKKGASEPAVKEVAEQMGLSGDPRKMRPREIRRQITNNLTKNRDIKKATKRSAKAARKLERQERNTKALSNKLQKEADDLYQDTEAALKRQKDAGQKAAKRRAGEDTTARQSADFMEKQSGDIRRLEEESKNWGNQRLANEQVRRAKVKKSEASMSPGTKAIREEAQRGQYASENFDPEQIKKTAQLLTQANTKRSAALGKDLEGLIARRLSEIAKIEASPSLSQAEKVKQIALANYKCESGAFEAIAKAEQEKELNYILNATNAPSVLNRKPPTIPARSKQPPLLHEPKSASKSKATYRKMVEQPAAINYADTPK